MLGSMTSLTGGGGLSMASGADGKQETYFDNKKYYKSADSGNSGANSQLLYVGLAALALFYVLGKK